MVSENRTHSIGSIVIKKSPPSFFRRLVPNGAIGEVLYIITATKKHGNSYGVWFPNYGCGEDIYEDELVIKDQ